MIELEIPIIKHFKETKQHKQKQKQKQSHSREYEHIFWETIRKNNIGIQFWRDKRNWRRQVNQSTIW